MARHTHQYTIAYDEAVKVLLDKRERVRERVPDSSVTAISRKIEPAQRSATGSEVTCRHNP
jgi:hypothetical protein